MRADWEQSARFRLQRAPREASLAGVMRERRRMVLIGALLCSTAFAAWTWWRPYAWQVDPSARCHLEAAQVRSDRGFYWLDLHVQVAPGATHDLMKPVRLITGSGRTLEPADTTLGGGPDKETSDLWFKFWLEPSDFDGPMKLQINDGSLIVRSGAEIPSLGSSNLEVFTTHNW
jgi:hypothetical protein